MTSLEGRRPEQRERTCYVPGCKSGYKSCKETRSLFRAPIEPERLAAWSRKIRRKDRPLSHACVVCDRHFDERFIERTFRTKINGEIVEIPRDRPLLAKDAIPTIFPEAPKYYTKKLPKKRKERNLCDQVLPKRKRRQKDGTVENACAHATSNAESETHDMDADRPMSERVVKTYEKRPLSSKLQDKQNVGIQVNGCVDAAISSDALTCEPGSPHKQHVQTTDERLGFSKLRIPKGWSEITLADSEGLCLYAQCEADAAEPYCSVVVVKSVRIEAQQGALDTAVAEVHLRGKIWCEQELTKRDEAEELIDSIDKLTLCPGVGVQPLTRECPAYNGKFFSKDCILFADSRPGRACARCRYQRKLIQNQMSYNRRRALEDVIINASNVQKKC
uniref:THAP-type domain-containing protein n=1 Tax=Rhipicephalus appendiculatus TaxID=34631 RepID=A0A131YKK8_RHIAP